MDTWKKGYEYGMGENDDASEKINSLKEQFVSRNAQITKDIKELKANLSKEKVDLTELIENRKNNELHVIELRSAQDKANEELRGYENAISRFEAEKEQIVHQKNEQEVNRRSLEIEVKEKQEKLNSFDEVKDIEGERDQVIIDLEKLQKRIMNLGPINFAAPETLEAEKQRKEILSGQIEELKPL